MEITAIAMGKRFQKELVFRNLDIHLSHTDSLAITGPNGSGKSTLIKIISGYSDPTLGNIKFKTTDNKVDWEDVCLKTALAAPYVNLIEEFTLQEHLDFHFTFKTPTLGVREIIKRCGLEQSLHKPIMDFSSGMKSRLKLALAIFSESELILLDEPTANMDEMGIQWYRDETKALVGKKQIIIASNARYEYDFIANTINLNDYKSIKKLRNPL